MTSLTLGFIPLTDCAPLVVAKARDFFSEEGLDVTLSREASWATVRDKVAVGALDGSHMLAPIALATTLGIGADSTAIIAPLALNRNGSAITVSSALARAMRDADPEAAEQSPRTARALAKVIARRREAGAARLTFAVVFPYSMHNYALRYWMAEAGIDPDRDVQLVVTPPPRMVEQLRGCVIDGFCVGAPWNGVAVGQGLGELVLPASQFWASGPDKVFGVTEMWAETNPDVLQAALRALLKAGVWADDPANRDELVALLARPEHVGAAPDAIAPALSGEIAFQRAAASFPWHSDAAWFLSQMVRWSQAPPDTDIAAVAASVYRPDLYRTAAEALGLLAPDVDSKIEGAHRAAWTLPTIRGPLEMSPDEFFDHRPFDPAQARDYAAGFEITRATPALRSK